MKRGHDLEFDEFVSDSLIDRELGYVEFPISPKVFWIISVVVALATSAILVRVGLLNLAQHGFFVSRAEANIHRETLVPAYRGIITDRYGTVLATNAETFSVVADLPQLLKDRSVLDSSLLKLSEAAAVPIAGLYQAINSADLEKNAALVIVPNISTEAAIAVRSLEIPAIRVENDYRREYPLGEAFSHVLGYTGRAEDGSAVIGKSGLEKQYNELLSGESGSLIAVRDATGQVIEERTTGSPTSGKQLITSLDAELQQYMYDRLSYQLRYLGLHAGAAIALNPQNGEVLSLISLPTFDNNLFAAPDKNKELAELFRRPFQPLFNRAVSGLYNPASTIKPLVAAAALKEHLTTPEYLVDDTKGYIEIPNPYFPDKPSRFVDWKAHGLVSLHSAIARSSNVYFYYMGGGFPSVNNQPAFIGLGIERLKKYWHEFGLAQPTNIDLGGEGFGTLPDPEYKEARTGQPWRLGDTYNVSIGQGDLLITPIQLVNYIATIANNGTRYEPRIVTQITDSDGTVFEQHPPVVRQTYKDWDSEFAEVRAGMRDGVTREYGTSHLLNDLPIAISGKTGSAQVSNNTKTNAFFTGFAPSQNPTLAILLLVEDSKEGSLNTIPIAHDIFQWYYENRIIRSHEEAPVSPAS